MFKTYTNSRNILVTISLISLFYSCKPADPAPSSMKVEYSSLTDTTSYSRLFKNAAGDSTVDRTEGKNIYHMFRGLNTYATTGIATNTLLDSTTLNNLFSNTGAPFTGTFPGTNAAALNTSGQSLRAVTGSSRSVIEAEIVRAKMVSYFGKLAKSSQKVTSTASKGQAGKLTAVSSSGTTSSYLVDEKGIEWIQIIQKSLIGGLQLDYIGNVLISDAQLSAANNSTVVTGKKYTQLEHNWDIAYGVITLKNRYASTASSTSNGGESFIGAYMWEYNKDGYPKIHPALLKGRAAIVNNDITEAKAQAAIIRGIMEKAIASAAVGYLKKWKDGTTDAARAHAIGEGGGFIYSLRFCKLNGADDAFSDDILNNLLYTPTDGYWDLNNDKVNDAISKINTKFGL